MRTVLCSLCAAYLISCSNPKEQTALRIATAANMKFAMDSLVQAFSKVTEVEIETIVSSSGKLTAQIIAGAPYDIYFSADTKYPQELWKKGLGITPPQTYAKGQIVAFSNLPLEKDLSMLIEKSTGKIAIANPTTAPYGRATLEALKTLQLASGIEERLVYGESISQVNHFIDSKAVDIGFTSLSSVEQFSNSFNWIPIDPTLHEPIEQSIIILTEKGLTSGFDEFLESPDGRSILEAFGYEPN